MYYDQQKVLSDERQHNHACTAKSFGTCLVQLEFLKTFAMSMQVNFQQSRFPPLRVKKCHRDIYYDGHK